MVDMPCLTGLLAFLLRLIAFATGPIDIKLRGILDPFGSKPTLNIGSAVTDHPRADLGHRRAAASNGELFEQVLGKTELFMNLFTAQ